MPFRIIDTERIPIKLWLEELENDALQQAKNAANLIPAFHHVAIMPDAHTGYGVPIGCVLATQDAVIPNAVGVDIGCGMCAARLTVEFPGKKEIKQVMGEIRKRVPVGFDWHKDPQEWEGFDRAPDIEIIQQNLEKARYQLGTLGGGNHFMEIQRGNDEHLWVMVHCGSRNFGLQIANHYHQLARTLCDERKIKAPNKDLSYLPAGSGKEGDAYMTAMNYAIEFAKANRDLIMKQILDVFSCESTEYINIHHNYAAFEHHFGSDVIVHRKGAVKAEKGEKGIIPGSQGSKSYIVEGLGNPESFHSSSHGAGRIMGRKQARRQLSLKDEIEKMEKRGIIHAIRTEKDLDEAESAYRDIDQVMHNQRDLVKILVALTPLAVIKG
ncbi:MAG TPA: RtcB family protein [Bacteroides sp.]|nr:RtcB family protein [Bacteroides sp.]